ncbi:hypothetical protein [Xanthomonas oryzae]|uniref:hypothetical protein n=1 Tax=Xanthomonas oryzae TaxID=347 RepID=UPI0014055A13|nr:hypothetical protein [Xanthomonas oryzae]
MDLARAIDHENEPVLISGGGAECIQQKNATQGTPVAASEMRLPKTTATARIQ